MVFGKCAFYHLRNCARPSHVLLLVLDEERNAVERLHVFWVDLECPAVQLFGLGDVTRVRAVWGVPYVTERPFSEGLKVA